MGGTEAHRGHQEVGMACRLAVGRGDRPAGADYSDPGGREVAGHRLLYRPTGREGLWEREWC